MGQREGVNLLTCERGAGRSELLLAVLLLKLAAFPFLRIILAFVRVFRAIKIKQSHDFAFWAGIPLYYQ